MGLGLKIASAPLLAACLVATVPGLAGAGRAVAQNGWPSALPPQTAPPTASVISAIEASSSLVPPTGASTPATADVDDPLTPITLSLALQPPSFEELPDGYLPTDAEDVPGAPDYDSPYDESTTFLPDYFYDADYFDEPGISARPLADYAPPGYEPRDYQDAPGVREFAPLPPPVRVTAEERDEFVTRGLYPGSYLVPGTNTSFRFRGFVRLAALFDFDPIGSTDSFVPNTIPVPQGVGQNFNMSGRISRFAVESWTPTDFCDWNIHTFIEGDFFNGPPQAAGGGGNPFRLRHAFFDFGYFRFGQQNTVFMDGSNWPSLVDFQGPNGWINQRQPSARMTLPVTDHLYWATSVERPFSDITTNGLGAAVQDIPDMATHLRYERDRGHLQIASLVRSIGYRPTGGNVSRLNGVGVSGSAVFHPWAILLGGDPVHDECPTGLTRSRILLQCTWGPGIARYVNDLVGQGLDAQVDPITGEFELVDATGWNASYEHWFNERWLTNFTYSEAHADNIAGVPATNYDAGRYMAGSLWWIPKPRLSFGIEYIRGERENVDGQSAEAQRLHGLAQYNF